MIADDDRDVDGEIAGLVAREQVVEAVVFFGDEERHATALAGETELPLHLVPAAERAEARVHFGAVEEEAIHRPLESHEEGVLTRVDVLLEVDDVAVMGCDESGDIVNESGLVGQWMSSVAVSEEGMDRECAMCGRERLVQTHCRQRG